MANKVLDIDTILGRDDLAVQISNTWDKYDQYRAPWMTQKTELMEYLFATDTTQTSNSSLPWKNKTVRPKLTQIRDNLHAQYMASLFPGDRWLQWQAQDSSSATKSKAEAIRSYMLTKLDAQRFRVTASKIILDFIDWGNCFGIADFENNKKVLASGEEVAGYVGPVIHRVPPQDIVFDITSAKFEDSPKIIRKLMGIGDIAIQAEQPGNEWMRDVLDKARANRQAVNSLSQADSRKDALFRVSGFNNWRDYFNSGYVELLYFYGNLYDIKNDTLYRDHVIIVADRTHVVSMDENPSWHGVPPIRHAGWRERPDNLLAMGPLDNLVGMQYRIDHLENLKADVWDMIAYPVFKIRGHVEDFKYGPNERIYVGDDGDVTFMSPDVTALNADAQIANLEVEMEELAGAPKQTMGIRTPGEKTAFEVDSLETAASRVFQNKTQHAEVTFFEPLFNDMLEVGVRNFDGSDIIRSVSEDLGIETFMTITKEDITAAGKLRPIGARHFAATARLVQELNSFGNTQFGRDPGVMNHFSGKKIARLFEEVLDLKSYRIVQDNVRIYENAEAEKLVALEQQRVQSELATPSDPSEEDVDLLRAEAEQEFPTDEDEVGGGGLGF